MGFCLYPQMERQWLSESLFSAIRGKKTPPTRPGELSLTSSAGGKCPKSVAKFGAQRGGFEMLGAYFQWSKRGTTLQAELETSSVLRGVANGNKPRTLGLTGISKGEDLEKRLRPALALEIVPWSWCSLVKLSACFFPLLYVYIYIYVHERVYCMVFYFGKPIGVDVSNCFYRSSSYLNVFSRSHQLSGYLQSHPRSALTRWNSGRDPAHRVVPAWWLATRTRRRGTRPRMCWNRFTPAFAPCRW